MTDRYTGPTRARHFVPLLPLAVSCGLLACGGKRFTTRSDSSHSSQADTSAAILSSVSLSTATIAAATVEQGTSRDDMSDGLSVAKDLDAGSHHGANATDQTNGTADTAFTPDDSTFASDASVIDTSSQESSEVDIATSEPPSPPTPTYPCNDGEFESPREVLGLGFVNHLWGPGISGDGVHLYFGHTEGDEDLFVARRAGSDPINFARAEALSTLNTLGSEGTPFVTLDGLSLYFYATRAGGPGDRDLWHAIRPDIDGAFDNPELVSGVNAEGYDHLPWLSADELTLCYTTLRADGAGQSDIWVATRGSKNDPFTDHHLLPGINTEAREDAVAFSPDGLTVFFSTDRDTRSDLDIWQATRGASDEDFADARVIAVLNSDKEDTNLSLTNDGRHLYFSSGRSGEQRIWVASRTCAPPSDSGL
jgi:hypothetical protein